MRREDVGDGAGGWMCLRLRVERSAVSGLRVEVASGGRMVITEGGGGARLVAWRRPQWEGVDWTRAADAGIYASPVGPFSAERARKISEDPGGAHTRWAHLFADRLWEAGGPLHSGTWILAPGDWPSSGAIDRAARWHASVHTDHPAGFVDWRPHAAREQILPLRQLSPADAGRVKALRKLARDGCLPPVLLWWISGLNCLVVLDGHDRIVAARAEGVAPPVLELGLAAREQQTSAALTYAESRYVQHLTQADERATNGDPLAPYAKAAAGREFARGLGRIAALFGPTRAWALPGGMAAWEARATAHAPGWLALTEAARHMRATTGLSR